MLKYSFRRILFSIPVLFVILLATFALGFYGPGDPLRTFYGEEIGEPDPAAIERLRKIHGLDRPFWVQFFDYIDGLPRGDFGKSILDRISVGRQMKASLTISAQLGGAAAVLLLALGVPLGILAAVKQNTWADYVIVGSTIAGQSTPVFVLGPLLMIVFVLWLDVMDTPVGWDGFWNTKIIMPVFLMALGPMLTVVRQMRSGVLEVLGQTYVRTARAKGLAERRVISRHIIKNAFTPVATCNRTHCCGTRHGSGVRRAGLCDSRIRILHSERLPGTGLSGHHGRRRHRLHPHGFGQPDSGPDLRCSGPEGKARLMSMSGNCGTGESR